LRIGLTGRNLILPRENNRRDEETDKMDVNMNWQKHKKLLLTVLSTVIILTVIFLPFLIYKREVLPNSQFDEQIKNHCSFIIKHYDVNPNGTFNVEIIYFDHANIIHWLTGWGIRYEETIISIDYIPPNSTTKRYFIGSIH